MKRRLLLAVATLVEGSATGNEWLKLTADPRSPDLLSWERIEF